ncbi:hemolysin family protein [Dendrosporobacter sp. 1207_IL3150]|uniref:hemolysin family protein n=1 Tax=Dendrosporobacter sp. 1207_IL3150 TaxID=3084054 RepID=UPI002FD96E44
MDTPTVGLEIVIILALILANGVFAMTEMAIVSSRKARLEKRADSGDAGARAALDLAEEPTPLLSTIQIGITLIGILTGTFGGATLTSLLAPQLKAIPFIGDHSEGVALLIVISIITYLSLIIGELVPKKLALNNPEPIAAVLARPMRAFSKLMSPVVSFLSYSTNFVLRLIGVKPSLEPPVTEDEIRILIEQGTEAGTFEKTEQDMVDKIFRLGDLRAYSLMTPRTQMTWLDLEEPLEYNLQIINDSSHTRFPVAKGSLDDFVGIIYTNDLLVSSIESDKLNLETAVRTPMFIPKSMKAFKILEAIKQSGTHEAVVLDEFGGVVGFITLHDILSEIIGDISQNDEPDEAQITQREDGSWLVDGLFPIDEFKEAFDVDELPDEDRDHYQTVGGFVISYLGYIPSASENFEWNGFRFEIMDMDRVRVDKVLISKVSPNKADPMCAE